MMKAGSKANDDALIDAAFARREKLGDAYLAAHDLLAAREAYASAVSDLGAVSRHCGRR